MKNLKLEISVVLREKKHAALYWTEIPPSSDFNGTIQYMLKKHQLQFNIIVQRLVNINYFPSSKVAL